MVNDPGVTEGTTCLDDDIKRAVEAKKAEVADAGQWKEFRGQRIRYVECRRYLKAV